MKVDIGRTPLSALRGYIVRVKEEILMDKLNLLVLK